MSDLQVNRTDVLLCLSRQKVSLLNGKYRGGGGGCCCHCLTSCQNWAIAMSVMTVNFSHCSEHHLNCIGYQIIRALRWQYCYLYSVYTAVSIQYLGLLNMQECSDVKYLNLQGPAGSSYSKFQHAMLQKCRGEAGLPHSNCKKVNIYSVFSYDMLRYRSPVFRRLPRHRWEWIVMTWISSVHFNNTFVSKIQRFIRFFWLPEYIDSWNSSVRVGI